MKTLVLSVFVGMLLFAAPAYALQCEVDLAEIDLVLVTNESGLSREDFQNVMVTFQSAMSLCDSGDETGAATLIAEMKAMLGI